MTFIEKNERKCEKLKKHLKKNKMSALMLSKKTIQKAKQKNKAEEMCWMQKEKFKGCFVSDI